MALIVEHGNSITITANGYTYAFRCPLAHTAQGAGYIYVLSGWEIRAINIATGVNTNLCYLITKAVDVIKMVVAHNTFILLITQTEWCRYDMINFMWIAGATSRCEDCGGSINQVGYTVTPADAVESHYTCGTKKTANLYIKNILYAINQKLKHKCMNRPHTLTRTHAGASARTHSHNRARTHATLARWQS